MAEAGRTLDPAGAGSEARAELARVASADQAAVGQMLGCDLHGLSNADAARRLAQYGPNTITLESRSLAAIARGQLSGINILLLLAGILTWATGDLVDGAIILALIILNVGLSIVQEYRAELALRALRALLPFRTRVERDGKESLVPSIDLVPGDVITVDAGDLVPADCRVLQGDALQVNEATLTGESEPRAKDSAPDRGGTESHWPNILLAGTTVVAGVGRAIVVATGRNTLFGQTASLVHGTRVPGDFQKNLSRFGSFLLRFGVLLAGIVLIANILLGRGVLLSLTLALALVLGMVPEALPAVTATALALGAAAMARQHVLVRRLASIEDLSAVDILCSDKTGTITENRTAVTEIWSRIPDGDVLTAALRTTPFPEGEGGIVDQAILAAARQRGILVDDLARTGRTTLVPFTAQAKRGAVIADRDGRREIIAKGMASVIVQRSTRLRTPEGDADIEPMLSEINAAIDRLQQAGARVLAVASRPVDPAETKPSDEGLTLLGLIAFSDPPRPGAAQALEDAERLAVTVKIVTGDALPRAAALAQQIGMTLSPYAAVRADQLRGADVRGAAERGRIFAEVIPEDKYRLVRALQEDGHHVAVTGDGVNDAPALSTADVGIAVASGSDAAKGAADLILLKDDLSVIVGGLRQGRATFTNINRYLLYTMVSNFANVLIVAIASLVLNYLPLLPEQVLLLNILADIPMLAIVTDRVSSDDLATPRRWSIRGIVELSLYLGVVNALFAFALLRLEAASSPAVVRTEWFLFLGSTALTILFAVRSPGWFWQGPAPSVTLVLALAACFVVTVGLINVPLTRNLLGFAQLGWQAQLLIEAYGLAYLLIADAIQQTFHRHVAPIAHHVQ